MTPLIAPLVSAEAVTFWICAPIAVLCAIGMILAKKAVHSALFLATVMIMLAAIYASLQAPFLFVVQIIVYTGAIMMLFLFVVMLVGVDTRESFVETIKGQRALSILGALGVLALLVTGLWRTTRGMVRGVVNPVAGDNVRSLAHQVFSTYLFPFELASALLITAAVGTMVMAHQQRTAPKKRQPQLQAERIRRYAETGEHPGARPASGVYARSNAITNPALLPDGSIAEQSVSPTLAVRGVINDPASLSAPTKAAYDEVSAARREELEA